MMNGRHGIQTVVDAFLDNAGKYPDHPAMMDKRGAYTYRMA